MWFLLFPILPIGLLIAGGDPSDPCAPNFTGHPIRAQLAAQGANPYPYALREALDDSSGGLFASAGFIALAFLASILGAVLGAIFVSFKYFWPITFGIALIIFVLIYVLTGSYVC
ncbi:hypothetical protein TI04_08345 [Achromatium sp. WMS2]|nr:hypothetical protein TI04_08345 [Achromatium sp. WMS2]